MLTLLLAACGPLVEGLDYRIDQGSRTIVARTTFIAENICRMRMVDAPPNFTVLGCYDPSDDVIIIAEDSPAWVIEHERAHRLGWKHQ